MPTVDESFCCQECPQTIAQMLEMDFADKEATSCITNFPFFDGAILIHGPFFFASITNYLHTNVLSAIM